MPTNKLKRYQEKRDFTRTAEPAGKGKVVPSATLRFVIQKHAASHRTSICVWSSMAHSAPRSTQGPLP